MGLAIWKTEESYKDLKYIVDEFHEDVFTALKNPNWINCQDSACDGNLVKTIVLQFCFPRQKKSLSLSFSSEVATSIWWTNGNFPHDISL